MSATCYWSPSQDEFFLLEDDGSAVAWGTGDTWESLPDDAIPLVPQASRDELREAIARVIHMDDCQDELCDVPDSMWIGAADAVLDVLAARGLVASPETGEGDDGAQER